MAKVLHNKWAASPPRVQRGLSLPLSLDQRIEGLATAHSFSYSFVVRVLLRMALHALGPASFLTFVRDDARLQAQRTAQFQGDPTHE